MAKKSTNLTDPAVFDTRVDADGMVDLPYVGSTTNFAKFGRPFERGGQGDQVAGVLYIPTAIAKGVKFLRVQLVKE